MMTPRPPLHSLRKRLARLGRARRAARWFTGLSRLLLIVLTLLTLLFAIDLTFHLDVAQRITVLLLATIALNWLCYRYALPCFGHRESETELALLVEQIHQITEKLRVGVGNLFHWLFTALAEQTVPVPTAGKLTQGHPLTADRPAFTT